MTCVVSTGLQTSKIRVLYPGVDAESLKSDDDQRAVVRAKYNLPARYFVFLGTLQPRKNIRRLVQAFVQWQRQSGDSDTHLVLAGGKGWLFDERWLHDATHVKLLGYIDEADKGALLSQALALVYPSLYEGFGFPVIEAMLCGTPVIASKTSSLPELVGDAGILVDPSGYHRNQRSHDSHNRRRSAARNIDPTRETAGSPLYLGSVFTAAYGYLCRNRAQEISVTFAICYNDKAK